MSRINRRFAVTKVTVPEEGEDGPKFYTDTRADTVTVEEPLEIRAQGKTLTSTMRTPGHDVELAHGWCFAEGLITSAEDVRTARYCAGAVGAGGENTYNLLDMELAETAQPVTPEFIRLTPTTSACGVCGTQSISELLHKVRTPITPIELDPELIVELPERLRAEQKQFRKTGGIHAAGAFDLKGNPIVVREDIGRHNAADKVIGHLLLDGALPARDMILVMSSRASFELVQKAAVAGFPALVAVSAASSLAVELAREANMALAGFVRNRRFNLYAGKLRSVESHT